jgi:hypothetical protein
VDDSFSGQLFEHLMSDECEFMLLHDQYTPVSTGDELISCQDLQSFAGCRTPESVGSLPFRTHFRHTCKSFLSPQDPNGLLPVYNFLMNLLYLVEKFPFCEIKDFHAEVLRSIERGQKS